MSRANAKHVWQSSIPGKRDNGERFEVRYKDGTGRTQLYGFANDRDTAESFVDAIKGNPMWRMPRIVDRGEVPF